MQRWQREVVKAQNEISEYCTDEDYEIYRTDEHWYWERCAAMMCFQKRDKVNVNNVLDIGCGYGTLAVMAKNLFDAEVYALDYKKRIPDEILRDKKIHFIEKDIELDEIPFRWPMVFDIIIFTEILEHLYFNPLETLIKLKRMLSRYGIIYLSTPDAAQWGRVTKWYTHVGQMPKIDSYKPDIDEHVYQWSEGELMRLFDEAGLKVEEMHFSSPPFWGRHFNLKLSKREI